MNLSYEWAIQTKRPGDPKDYRVLGHTQGVISDKEFDRVFRSLSVGELPDASDPYNPPPPWVAFGFLAVAQTVYLACIRQDWTDQQDATSRQISYASCLCVPFEQIGQVQPSLAQLARLHDAVNLPAALRQIAGSAADQVVELERARLTLEKPVSLEPVASQIDTIGFDYLAGIAATFLVGPVVLVGGKPNWEESLANLEAVLALLPYGARANATVSNWTRTATMNSLRASFSSSASRDKEYIQWVPQATGQKPAPSPKMHMGYYNMLVEAHRRHPTLEIVRHLAGSIQQLTFEDPEPFVSALRLLDRPFLILQSLASASNIPNPGLQAEIRELLESGQSRQLNPADRQKMLGYLLAVGSDPLNPPVLAKNWNSTLWADLVARTGQEFTHENQPGLLYCLEVARASDKLEDFIGVLLRSENLSTRHSRGVAIQLLRKALKAAPEPARDPLFILLGMTSLPPEFSVEWAQMVAKDTSADDRDHSIIISLCHSPEFAHRSLRIALGLQNEVLDVESLNAVTRADPGVSVWLLTVALKNKCLKNVILAFSQWALKNNFRPSPQEFQNAWEAMFTRLDTHIPILDPVPCASFDVVWLNFSGNRQPLWLSRALQSELDVFNPYADTFSRALETSGINQSNVARNLDSFLGQYMLHPLGSSEIVRLDLFLEDVNQTLNDERLFMTQQKSKLRQYLSVHGRSIKDVSACCVSILNDQRIKKNPSEMVISEMVDMNYIFPPTGVEELLQQVESQAPEQFVDFEEKLIRAILDGKFGPIQAQTYRQRWPEKILYEIDELTRHLGMLNPKDPNLPKISAELDAKLGKFLPKRGGLLHR